MTVSTVESGGGRDLKALFRAMANHGCLCLLLEKKMVLIQGLIQVGSKQEEKASLT
jgi:hypothetical protein